MRATQSPAWILVGLWLTTLTAGACKSDSAKSQPDAGHDAGPTQHDAGHDAGGHDAGSRDAASMLDAALDAGHDSGAHDASTDASTGDDAGDGFPTSLADTGLYSDFANETLAPHVQAFEPQFVLWSDGATKKRYFYLPPGTKIDTSDMDAWQFPVGTKAWKEFTRGGVRVETRLLEKTDQGWFMMAFVWNQAQTEALAAPLGKKNANGTQHDVPASSDCHVCHDGMPDRLLGVSAIQLSHGKPGMNLTSLINGSRLTAAPAGNFVVPGAQADIDALGALHANCGHCHNDHGAAWDRASGMVLRLLTGQLGSVSATPAYTTTVGVALVSKTVPGATMRIVKTDKDHSGLYLRLTAQRGTGGSDLAMPPLATELQDTDTETKLSNWITNLP
jgi:hypothetical protein